MSLTLTEKEINRRAKDVLGIKKNSTAYEIKQKYHNLCKKYHPDKNPTDPTRNELGYLIIEAYSWIQGKREPPTFLNREGLVELLKANFDGTQSHLMYLIKCGYYDFVRPEV